MRACHLYDTGRNRLALGVLLAFAAWVGCAKPAITVCANVDCPASEVCDPTSSGCLFPEQLSECDGSPDDTSCTYNDDNGPVSGACTKGVCLPLGCGNGILTANEVCDDGNTTNGDGCSADCLSNEACGNHIVDPAKGEQCDDGNTVDGDGCEHDCLLPRCGDGVVDNGEQCDIGSANSEMPDAVCRTNCTLPRCGDHIVDPSLHEVCDDGNTQSGDGCSADCLSDETCGNGIVDVLVGEVCDNGSNNGSGAGSDGGSDHSRCSANCKSNETCGNKVVDTDIGEVCDDGNNTNGDGCSADCRSLEVCGDGEINTEHEQCDNGTTGSNANSNAPNAECRTDCSLQRCGDDIIDALHGEVCDHGSANSDTVANACRTSCQPAHCGDRVVDTGEVCDDGNAVSGDGCSADCKSTEVCGNGITDPTDANGSHEQCDDGNASNADFCHTNCQIPRCGDSIVDVLFSEQCDNGSNNGSGANQCRLTCQLPRCGDHIVDTGEVCDDGNTTSGDGCSADCKSNETCGNGIVDPAKGEKCDAGSANANTPNAPCRPTCKLPGCGDGITDSSLNEQCDAGSSNSNAPNAACRPGCVLPRCGDGVIDSSRGEVCDDGNLTAGDGCRPDCKSNETCGNGIVDLEVLEECDDANTRGRDGCSLCKSEDAVVLVPGQTPPVREQHSMAYDAARQRVVMFGGFNTAGMGGQFQRLNDTWEWDGVSWTQMHPRDLPSPRRLAQMAYDPVRHRVLLTGGDGADGELSDTWSWDGADWTQLQPTTPAPATEVGAMAFDPVRNTMVLVSLSSVVEFNGTTWAPLANNLGGVTIEENAMATDPVRKQIVMIAVCCSAFNNHTLTWDGATWTDHGVGPISSNEPTVGLAFDASRGAVILTGDTANTTYEWNGTSWATVAGTAPTQRSFGAAAYDAARKQVVTFGGQQVSPNAQLQDTWLRTGQTWTQPGAWVEPPLRLQSAVIDDPVRKRIVLYAGQTNANFWDGQTWEWDGRQWTKTIDDPTNLRRGSIGLYDVATRKVMTFGGQLVNSDEPVADLQVYSGSAWSQQATSTGRPDIRNSYATYDVANDRVLTFAGRDDANTFQNLQHTWSWTTAAGWKLLPKSGTQPPARRNHAIAYDPIRKRTVVFGGFNDSRVALRDLWEFDGTSWTNPQPTGQIPSARFGFEMLYNPDAAAVVVYGNGPDVDDLWEWNGSAWTQRPLDSTVTAHYRGAVGYDSAREELVTFGGRDSQFNDTGTTQLIQYRPFVTVEACTSSTLDYDNDGKAGCADDDCWRVCNPLCPPGVTCPAGSPSCGDHVCSATEDCNICPGDCGVCAGPVCGDFYCSAGESTTCPSDCL
jgi:cysteine-rich repeat protein